MEKVCLCNMTHHAGTPLCQTMVTWIEFLCARTFLQQTVPLGGMVVARAKGRYQKRVLG